MKKGNRGYILLEVLVVISISVFVIQYLLQSVISTQRYVNSTINRDNAYLDQDMISSVIQSQFSKSICIDEILTTDERTLTEIPTEEVQIKAVKLSQLDDASESYNMAFGKSNKFYESNVFIFLRKDLQTSPICIHKIKSNQNTHCSDVIGKFHYEFGNRVKQISIKKISGKIFEMGIVLENDKEPYYFIVALLE